MIVGLYDQDMGIYHQFPFNLELMKWATYYKRQRHIVKLTSDFAPHRYSQFIYQKDINDGIFEPNLNSYPNLTYGGLAFTNNIYRPLSLDFEACQPDPYIYQCMNINFHKTLTDKQFFMQLLKAQHMRISLDGRTVWSKADRQLNLAENHTVLYLHDFDISKIEGGREYINEITKLINSYKRECLIGTKFPLRFYNELDLLEWLQKNLQNNLMTIQFNGLLSDEILAELIQVREKTAYERRIEYVITYGCSTEDDFFLNRLPQIYKQVIFLRSQKQKISLKYEPEFFSSRIGANTVRLLDAFCNSKFYNELDLKYDSLYSFASKMKETYENRTIRIVQSDAREVFQFIREKNYELFKQFYELHKVELKGGKLYDSI